MKSDRLEHLPIWKVTVPEGYLFEEGLFRIVTDLKSDDFGMVIYSESNVLEQLLIWKTDRENDIPLVTRNSTIRLLSPIND